VLLRQNFTKKLFFIDWRHSQGVEKPDLPCLLTEYMRYVHGLLTNQKRVFYFAVK